MRHLLPPPLAATDAPVPALPTREIRRRGPRVPGPLASAALRQNPLCSWRRPRGPLTWHPAFVCVLRGCRGLAVASRLPRQAAGTWAPLRGPELSVPRGLWAAERLVLREVTLRAAVKETKASRSGPALSPEHCVSRGRLRLPHPLSSLLVPARGPAGGRGSACRGLARASRDYRF